MSLLINHILVPTYFILPFGLLTVQQLNKDQSLSHLSFESMDQRDYSFHAYLACCLLLPLLAVHPGQSFGSDWQSSPESFSSH